MITRKEAFKLGFVTRLASAGVSPVDIVDHVLTQKSAAASMLALPAGLAAAGGIATSQLARGTSNIGSGLGGIASELTDDDADSISNLRKEYLIKKYSDLIRRRRADIEARLMTEAKRRV